MPNIVQIYDSCKLANCKNGHMIKVGVVGRGYSLLDRYQDLVSSTWYRIYEYFGIVSPTSN